MLKSIIYNDAKKALSNELSNGNISSNDLKTNIPYIFIANNYPCLPIEDTTKLIIETSLEHELYFEIDPESDKITHLKNKFMLNLIHGTLTKDDFYKSSIFYFISGYAPEINIKDAVDVVDAIRNEISSDKYSIFNL